MKRILFLLLALSFYGSVNAQLFTQDFSSSTTVADYVSATPNLGQFEGLSQSTLETPPNLETIIENGALRFSRIATAGIYAFRNYSFSTKPTFVQLKMDFDASSAAVSNNLISGSPPAFSVLIGNSFTSANSGATSNFTSRFYIFIQNAAGDFKINIPDNTCGAPTSVVYSGKQTITFIVNNSGSDQTYTAPDTTTQTILNGKIAIWVGTTKTWNVDTCIKNTTSPKGDISGFKIQSGGATSAFGNFDFDNIEFKDLLVTLSTSKFENSVADVKVYPNPTEGVFEIKNLPLSLETIKLGLYSLDSKLLESKTYNVNNGTVKLDISGLAKGVYFVKGDSDNPFVSKVIKK